MKIIIYDSPVGVVLMAGLAFPSEESMSDQSDVVSSFWVSLKGVCACCRVMGCLNFTGVRLAQSSPESSSELKGGVLKVK